MTEIKLGTSGWRGIMAEDFTFPKPLGVPKPMPTICTKKVSTHQGTR